MSLLKAEASFLTWTSFMEEIVIFVLKDNFPKVFAIFLKNSSWFQDELRYGTF
jgi:hypothetical protein